MEEWVITTAITLGIGIITYFLKRTMSQVDRQGTQLQEMINRTATKAEEKEQTEKLEQEIRQIRDDYTPKEMHRRDFDECRTDIKQIRSDYLTKDDFIREMNKMDRKLDQMLDLMMNKQ
ncbi:MAG: hypothetical protein LUG91_09805 [Ruminococcus sp.]|nr:hypothetical protein [Ruminococcus sp.]